MRNLAVIIFLALSFSTFAQINLLEGIERKFHMNLGDTFPTHKDYPTLETDVRNLPFQVYSIPGKFEAVVNDFGIIDAIVFDGYKNHRLPKKLKETALQLATSNELKTKVKNATNADTFKKIAKKLGGTDLHQKDEANQYDNSDKSLLSISFYLDDYLITGYFTKAKKKTFASLGTGLIKDKYLSILKIEEAY